MTQYAKSTNVTPEQTRNDIEAVLRRYGADAFAYAVDDKAKVSLITFRLRERVMRFYVNIPRPEELEPRPRKSTSDVYDQAVRQRWRALLLYTKALCEAIENQVVTLDQAFMPYVVLPDGRTMAEWATPQMQQLAVSGRMPALLPGIERGE